MHKRVFMYGCLTMMVSLSASDLPTTDERVVDRSPLSVLVQGPRESAAQRLGLTESDLPVMTTESTSERTPNLKVSIPGVGPVEATLSDNQTKYLTGLAAVVVLCCTFIAHQNPELIPHLLGQK